MVFLFMDDVDEKWKKGKKQLSEKCWDVTMTLRCAYCALLLMNGHLWTGKLMKKWTGKVEEKIPEYVWTLNASQTQLWHDGLNLPPDLNIFITSDSVGWFPWLSSCHQKPITLTVWFELKFIYVCDVWRRSSRLYLTVIVGGCVQFGLSLGLFTCGMCEEQEAAGHTLRSSLVGVYSLVSNHFWEKIQEVES